MRKVLFLLAFLMISVSAYAELKPFSYLFVGKWNPSEDPLLLEEYGIQDVQNMRKDGRRWRGVKGHTKINSSSWSGDYPKPKNMFHFNDPDDSETAVLVYSQDSTNQTSGIILNNSTAIPNTGDFNAAALGSYVNTTASIGRFANTPLNEVAYADGQSVKIWGGDKTPVGAAYISPDMTATQYWTGLIDATTELTDINTSTTAVMSAGNDYLLLGFVRPIQGFNLYFPSGNPANTVSGVSYWSGTAWTSVTGLTDNTSNLTTSGTITFDSTKNLNTIKYISGYVLYWYYIDTAGAATTLYHVSGIDEFQDIKDVWDGVSTPLASFVVSPPGVSQKELVDYANDDTTSETVGIITAGTYSSDTGFYLGFTQPMMGAYWKLAGLVDNNQNTNDTVWTVSYWNGSAWTAVSGLQDETRDSGNTKSLYYSGVVSWTPVDSSLEKMTSQLVGGIPLYVYRFVNTGAFDAVTSIQHVYGIKAPVAIDKYDFPILYQNRLLLCGESNDPSKCIYSGYTTSAVWNGSDTGTLYFGSETPMVGGGVIYNIFRTTGLEQLIITKTNETWRMYGDGPSSWVIQRMSENIGCVAPLSIAVCEVSNLSTDDNVVGRHVMMWQSDKGVVMCDGASVQIISNDIKQYWDQNDAAAIPTGRMDDSFGWYDSTLNAYKLLITSGAGQTTHNVELEFNLQTNEWTKIYRENSSGANPLQAATEVRDTVGNAYTYGATDEGFMYFLESTNTQWDDTPIAQYIQTKNLLLDDQAPFFRDTTIDYFRLTHEDKATNDNEDISVAHYCNDVLSVEGTDYQELVDDIDMADGPIYTQDVNLGPCMTHSFKLTASISSTKDGMELTGLGLFYDPQNTINTEN